MQRALVDLPGRLQHVGGIASGHLETLAAAEALIGHIRHEADRRARERADEGPANLDEAMGALGVQARADEAPPEPAPGGRRRGRRPRG
jgi:hypothetical protein